MKRWRESMALPGGRVMVLLSATAAVTWCGTQVYNASPGSSGNFSMTSTVTPPPTPLAACAEATLLEPSKAITGTTADLPDLFRGSCARQYSGPDKTYRLDISSPSRVRIHLQTQSHDGVLHLHRGCPAASDSIEVGCNDDYRDNTSSFVYAWLEPGMYFVIVDGADSLEAGNYSLTVDLFSPSASKKPGDLCDDAPLVELSAKGEGRWDGLVKGDAFYANDDFQPPCSPSPGGADLFHRFHIESPSIIEVETKWRQSAATVLSILRGCKKEALTCGLDNLEATLPGGDYLLAVDSPGADLAGAYELQVKVQQIDNLLMVCKEGTMLKEGREMRGEITGEGSFTGCGRRGYGPEKVHILKVTKKKSLRIEVNPEGFDSVLYIRRSCTEPASEVACNDDSAGTPKSILEATFEKGTYYVFVDSLNLGEGGSYTIKVTSMK